MRGKEQGKRENTPLSPLSPMKAERRGMVFLVRPFIRGASKETEGERGGGREKGGGVL